MGKLRRQGQTEGCDQSCGGGKSLEHLRNTSSLSFFENPRAKSNQVGASPKAKEMGGDPCWRAFGGKMVVTEGYKQEESCSLDLECPPKRLMC